MKSAAGRVKTPRAAAVPVVAGAATAMMGMPSVATRVELKPLGSSSAEPCCVGGHDAVSMLTSLQQREFQS